MSSAPKAQRRSLGKQRGRDLLELCTCQDCKRCALPGDDGVWMFGYELTKHRSELKMRRARERQRGKRRRVGPSQNASSSAQGAPENEDRGEGPSKRARTTTYGSDEDAVFGNDPFIESGPPEVHANIPLLPPEEHTAAMALYEDPEEDSADEALIQMILEREGPRAAENMDDPPSDADSEPARLGLGHLDNDRGDHDHTHTDAALTESHFTLPLSRAPRPPGQVLADSHDLWFVRVILVLVAFLNTKFHVPFRACALILFTLRQVFIALNVLPPDGGDMPETLKTTFKRLELEDRFHLLVACPSCFQMYEPTTSEALCSACKTDLFDTPRSSTISNIFRQITRKELPKPKPKLPVPYQPLGSLLTDMLARPGMEDEVDAWRAREREDGKYNEIMDGAVWKTMRGADEKLFFAAQDDSELRIGVTLGLDWFSCARSAYAASHSSGVYSFCVSNLPPALRYRPKNLLVSMMTPGPKEPDAEQLQQFNALLVNDLLELYEHGILIPTPFHPNGRLVRVALVGIVCDHPAMCKMCGFADKSHKQSPCTKCHATSSNMFDDDWMTGRNGLKSGDKHKKHAAEWKNLDTDEDQNQFFSEHGVRWSEFTRLPYFDPIRMTIVDPMHNLLLGIVKTQWYNHWIQSGALRATTGAGTERELADVHAFLDSFEAPAWVGRLPTRVGEPAGGSLSADEYKCLITISGAMMLPIVFDRVLPDVTRDHEKALARWKKARTAASKGKNNKQPSEEEPEPRLCEDEIRLMLLLATSLKILLGSSLDEASLERGEQLLLEYLRLYKKIYGVKAMKPNFHFSTHTAPQIRDYGPVPGFWAFLGERLNKVLKSSNLNNHHRGELEIIMMRAFGRDVQLHELMVHLSNHAEEPVLRDIATRMLADNEPPRGTVETLAQEPYITDDALLEFTLAVSAGPVARAPSRMPDRVRAALYRRYNTREKIVYWNSERRPSYAWFLESQAQYYKHVLIDGWRVVPLNESRECAAASSMVKVLIDGKCFAGEVLSVFHHHQRGVATSPTLFAEMRWMKHEMLTPVPGDPWEAFPELGFECWTLNEFHDDDTPGIPPGVVPVSAIRCQLARMTDHTSVPPIWMTTSLDRHSIVMNEGFY